MKAFLIVFAIGSSVGFLGAQGHDAVTPLEGWNAFKALCVEHKGATDAVQMYEWNGREFAPGNTWRIECHDVELVIPNSWFEAGMNEASPAP